MRLQADRFAPKRMNPLVMKSLNAIELMKLIRRHGRISRSTLASLSRLSKPTVSDQVDSLLARGLVVEVGSGDASARGGKRPTLLEFNADFGRILCVDVGAESIRFASADLMGTVLRRLELPTLPEQGAKSVIRTVKRGISGLLSGNSTNPELRLISVAVPGIVDVRNGVVLETDNVFGWRKLDIAGALSNAFRAAVHVDNDVNMAALAELHAGGDHGTGDFVLVRLNTGIGAGVVLGGRLHHGAHWAAGEIGHIVPNVRAAAGPANPRGHLESVVGADCVNRRVRKAARGMDSELAAIIRRQGGWAALQVAAERSGGTLREEIDDLTLHLACAVTNIAAMYDPELVILHGEPFPFLLERIRELTCKLIPWPIEIRLSELGADASLQGALAAGLARAYGQIASSLDAEGWSEHGVDHDNRRTVAAAGSDH
jgi:predicted NBD/HSP70 family sugar kinase